MPAEGPAILNLKVLWVERLHGRKNPGAGGMSIPHFSPRIGTGDAKTAILGIAAAGQRGLTIHTEGCIMLVDHIDISVDTPSVAGWSAAGSFVCLL